MAGNEWGSPHAEPRGKRRTLEESEAMIKRREKMDATRVKEVRELTRLYECMCRAGFGVREREVKGAAERMWRTAGLNYSSFDAFKWGEEFWRDQPSGEGALLEAAEQDARELNEVGVDLKEVVRKKQSRVAGRMTRESILSRTTPVVDKWVEGEQQRHREWVEVGITNTVEHPCAEGDGEGETGEY